MLYKIKTEPDQVSFVLTVATYPNSEKFSLVTICFVNDLFVEITSTSVYHEPFKSFGKILSHKQRFSQPYNRVHGSLLDDWIHSSIIQILFLLQEFSTIVLSHSKICSGMIVFTLILVSISVTFAE